ncbi:MAG TPA: sigma-54 dependent transcriptional regulator [Gemmataceae bacterium]|nr:sigma-54 dependent transcriptional regulator [Gemmataceae bacterium]
MARPLAQEVRVMDKVLLVEDNPYEQRAVATFLKEHGYEVLLAADGTSACQLVAQIPDIILTDLNLPQGDGLEVLREARHVLPETPVIIMTGHGSVGSAVEAMKDGAFDYLTKPVNPEELLLVIERAAERSLFQREVRRLRQQVQDRGGLCGMVGKTEPMRRIFDQIELVAPTRSTVLITGESGTGKELVARAIHQLSPRKDGAFVALNCAAIPKDLAESELFGHARGAFTGATERRIGKFAAADGGTLLIDEIGEMELPVQAKLVRTLETRMVSPVGSNEEQSVDVRVIAATHRNLRSLADEGRFREDLYFRLRVVQVNLPTLRQRRADIPLLVATFLQQLNQEHSRNVRGVSLDAMNALQSNSWPGNVRELRNSLEGIVVLSRKEAIDLVDLPVDIQGSAAKETGPRFRPGITLTDLEREAIQECLHHSQGNRQRTADLLGISTRTLLRKIRHYRLADPLLQTEPVPRDGVPGHRNGMPLPPQ